LQTRFPDDLAWKVTYDPTAFVTATIKEVEHTLIEAFVLVVHVVFLFLGSFRSTLIPTFAVPVSLIGTFIALKAIGYSANSVSLLAVVLAIGIVVDDAIVVVENVERALAEHPELPPAEAEAPEGRTVAVPAWAAIGWTERSKRDSVIGGEEACSSEFVERASHCVRLTAN